MDKERKNLTNDEFADIFYRYQKGKLSIEEKEAFERQLAGDKLKRMAADGLSAISQDDFLKSKQKFGSSNYLHNYKKRKKVRFTYTVTAIAAIFILGLIVNTVFFTEKPAPPNNLVSGEELPDTNKTNSLSLGSSNKRTGLAKDTSLVYPITGYGNFDKYVRDRMSKIPDNHFFPDSILIEISILPNGHVDTVIVKKGVNEAVDLKIKDIIKNGPLWKTKREGSSAINETAIRKIYIKTN
ncbi:MAG: hypothetical protein AB2L20_12340 [Mangrovibacterium sp.]